MVMGGIITEYRRLATKSGSTMAFVKVEDVYGQIEVVVFPKVFDNVRNAVKEEETVKVTGRIQIKDGVPQIIAENIEKLEVAAAEPEKERDKEYLGLILENGSKENVDGILDILESYPGNIPATHAIDGKKYNSQCSVRKGEALISELRGRLKESNVIFFRKKQ